MENRRQNSQRNIRSGSKLVPFSEFLICIKVLALQVTLYDYFFTVPNSSIKYAHDWY